MKLYRRRAVHHRHGRLPRADSIEEQGGSTPPTGSMPRDGEPWRRRWGRVPFVALTAAAVFVVLIEVAIGIGWRLGPWRAHGSKLLGDATWPAGARSAPRFKLFDQHGHSITQRSLDGHTTIVTFLYSHCRELCPTIGAELTQIQRAFPAAAQPQLVIFSVDPRGDTPQSVETFAANEAWNGHWHWLLGTKRELAPLWHAYGIQVKPGGGGIAHSGAVYLIDSHGNERSGYVAPFLVQDVVHDVRTLEAPTSVRRRVELAATIVVALGALLVLVLQAPWAGAWRAHLQGFGRRRRLWAAAAATVLVAALAVILLRPASSAQPVAGALIPARARQPARTLAGGTVLVPPRVSLSAARGRIVYINFFASWCAPCRQEAPALRAFANSLDPRKALLVGVNVSDEHSNAIAFIRHYQLRYPILADTSQTLSRRYQLLGLPTTIVIDRRGRIAVQLLGPQPLTELRATLKRL